MRHRTTNTPFLERGGFGLLAFVALVVFAFEIMPALRLLLTALAPGGSLDPGKALAALSGRSALKAAQATLETAFFSTLLAVPLGTAMALALGITDMRGRRLASFLFVLSVMISPQVIALAFLHLAGPASPILNTLGLAPEAGSANPMLGRGGIILVLGLHHAPLVYVVMSAGLKRIPLAVVEAARVDGARPLSIVIDHALPLLRPHLLGAGLLAFVAGIGNFGIPALLGAPVNYLTLPVLIYRRLSSFGTGMLGDVAALGLLVAVIAILCVAVSQILTRRGEVLLEEDAPLQPFWHLGRARAAGEVFVASVIALVLILPMLSLLTAALVPSYGMPLNLGTITLDNFAEVLTRQDATMRAFANSLAYAGGAAGLLAVLGIPMAYTLVRLAGPARIPMTALLETSYVLPGIVLAIACILLFLKPLPLIGLSLYATPSIIVFAYLARFLAVVLKPVLAGMAQIDVAQEEAATLDGAGLTRRLIDIVLPSLLPAAVAGGLMAFLLAFSELTVSALLWSAGTETIGVVLYSLEEAGLASQASAVAVVIVAVVTLAMLALHALGRYLPAGTLPWHCPTEGTAFSSGEPVRADPHAGAPRPAGARPVLSV
ncbi:ABC transporter permease [Microvirga sp. M2]|uniref:ABC transporter permease n=1 Tax=Microvirga sp. M2 TaxID=3073270 RepID=UPI0039C044DE